MRRVTPHIIKPMHAVCAAEKVQSIVPADHGVIRTRRRDLAVGRAAINGVLDKDLPAVGRLL